MFKKKYKPITPNQQDMAFLRSKLKELIRRMKADYDRWLKPLVLKMSKEERERVEQSNELTKVLQKVDSEKYFNTSEAAKKLRTLKHFILEACRHGHIKDVVSVENGTDFLIPEESLIAYGVEIGKLDRDKTLVERFNARLNMLVEKYNSLFESYQRISEKFTDKMYKEAKKKFFNQFKKESNIDVIKNLSEKGLKEAFDLQVAQNVQLIKSIPQDYFLKIQEMVTKSTTGGFDYEGGLQKAILDLGYSTRKKAALIARDQSTKAVATFTRLRFQNLGVQKYIWRNSQDKRVAGNPNGLYPDVDPKSKYHGNHWKREGKIFEWKNPPPDGNPGEGINCRCWAEPIFEEEEEAS